MGGTCTVSEGQEARMQARRIVSGLGAPFFWIGLAPENGLCLWPPSPSLLSLGVLEQPAARDLLSLALPWSGGQLVAKMRLRPWERGRSSSPPLCWSGGDISMRCCVLERESSRDIAAKPPKHLRRSWSRGHFQNEPRSLVPR